MLVVLGLDSLDYQRLQRYETPHLDALTEMEQLRTPEGLGPDELITQVLWPSMLIGGHPRDLFPSYYQSSADETKEWGNPLLDSGFVRRLESVLASQLSRKQKERIKQLLSDTGMEKSHIGRQKLEAEGSLLDVAENPNLISVPGINEDSTNRELKEMVGRTADTEADYSTAVDGESFERAALKADSDRLIRTLNAIESRHHDLVFSHLFSFDLIQHVWVSSEAKMARWHGIYDDFVGRVMAGLESGDVLVVVSDHGMSSDGRHSTQAVYGASKSLWPSKPCRSIHLRDVLETELHRDEHQPRSGDEVDELEVSESTKEHLEELGYF